MTPPRSKKISSGSNRSHTQETEHMSRLFLKKPQTVHAVHPKQNPANTLGNILNNNQIRPFRQKNFPSGPCVSLNVNLS